MYALIILRHRKPPELLTIFRDRNDFIAALGFKKKAEPWLAATRAFRAVYEVHDEGDFARSLDVIRAEHPQDYEACHALLRKFQIPNGLAR
jgi:hypothetical protein